MISNEFVADVATNFVCFEVHVSVETTISDLVTP